MHRRVLDSKLHDDGDTTEELVYLCRGEAAIRQLVESMHRNMGGSHIIQVPPCVNAKIRADGHPHVLMPSNSPILHHQSCIPPAAVT